MGNIGREIETREFEPMPDDIPVPEIVPRQAPEPARTPARVPEPATR